MSNLMKRKRSDIDDSDDEEPSLGRQVLPVANLPTDFSGEPMDGLQYLFTVRRDSRLLPHTTRVHNPYDVKEEPPESANIRVSSGPAIRPMPSEEWREMFMRHFRNFRKNSTQSTIHVDKPARNTAPKVLPDKKERDAWWAFISGQPEFEWNPPKKPKTLSARAQRQQKYGRGMRGFSDEWTAADAIADTSSGDIESTPALSSINSLPTPSGTPAPSERDAQSTSRDADFADSASSSSYEQREPTPSLLRNVDHRYSLHLLMYFTHWINLHLEQPHPRNSHMSETHARWIFALLSRVEDYVSADEMSLLRNLTRACMALLRDAIQGVPPATAVTTQEDPEFGKCQHMSERSCWMIIQIVVGHWAQRDLWMDAENMLAELSIKA